MVLGQFFISKISEYKKLKALGKLGDLFEKPQPKEEEKEEEKPKSNLFRNQSQIMRTYKAKYSEIPEISNDDSDSETNSNFSCDSLDSTDLRGYPLKT